MAVLVVALIALLISLTPGESVLNLVGNPWAGFGAAFGPLILLSLMWNRTTGIAGLFGLIIGGSTVLGLVLFPRL